MRSIYMFIIIFFLYSCNNEISYRYKDRFYNLDNREFKHIPLIKPYELTILNDEPWCLIFNNLYVESTNFIKGVHLIDVKENIIFFYSPTGVKSSHNKGKYFFFVYLKKEKVEVIKPFLTESELNLFILKESLPSPNWKDVDSVWIKYKNTGLLPWLDCRGYTPRIPQQKCPDFGK